MVQEIGERAFDFYLQPLGNRERLAQSGREADGSRACYDTHAAIAKSANWRKVHTRVVADGASLAELPTQRPRADESAGIEPLICRGIR